MSTIHHKTPQQKASEIEQILRDEYGTDHVNAEIMAYDYNPAAIRVRIIDPDFAGMTKAQRESKVWEILSRLDEDVRDDITVCLLITPDERPSSLLSLEFDDPGRSKL